MNHFRLPTSVATFALNDVKCLLIDARSSSIRSRKRDRRSGPSSSTPSTTRATAFSHGVSGSARFPAASSRSEMLSLRSPPQVDALRRDLGRGEDAPADQVEQRRGELERAGFASLSDQRRDERGLRLRRRLLLVLAVVAGLELASVEPEDSADGEERRDRAEQEQIQGVPPRVTLRVLDPLAVLLEPGCVRRLLRRRSRRGRCRAATFMPRVERNAARGTRCGARRTVRRARSAPAGGPSGRRAGRRRARRRGGPRREDLAGCRSRSR